MIHLMVCMALLIFTHMLCLAAMSEFKYSYVKTARIYFVTGLICVGITAAAFLFFSYNLTYFYAVAFTSTITVGFFSFMVISTDPIAKKVFLFMSYSSMFCIFGGITSIISGIFLKELDMFAQLYARNIIRTLFYIPAGWLYIKYLRPIIRGIRGTKKTWNSISLVSVLFLIVISILISLFYADIYAGINYVVLFVIVTVIYCSVLWVILVTIQQMSRENKMELIEQKAKFLQEQLETAKENELGAKRMKHDYRHHIQNIAAMLKNGDVEHSLCYIEKYNDSLDSVNGNKICPHITVNAILARFYDIAQNSGISISVFADTPQQSAIADIDFVAILSNVLENAVNGCKECGISGEIKVNIRTIENKTVIVCSNSCREDIEIENNMIKNKGVGIDSIIASLRKYNGAISYKLEKGILTVCIILKS